MIFKRSLFPIIPRDCSKHTIITIPNYSPGWEYLEIVIIVCLLQSLALALGTWFKLRRVTARIWSLKAALFTAWLSGCLKLLDFSSPWMSMLVDQVWLFKLDGICFLSFYPWDLSLVHDMTWILSCLFTSETASHDFIHCPYDDVDCHIVTVCKLFPRTFSSACPWTLEDIFPYAWTTEAIPWISQWYRGAGAAALSYTALLSVRCSSMTNPQTQPPFKPWYVTINYMQLLKGWIWQFLHNLAFGDWEVSELNGFVWFVWLIFCYYISF